MTLAAHKARCDQLDAALAAATADLRAEVEGHAERIAVIVRLARLGQLADRKAGQEAIPTRHG